MRCVWIIIEPINILQSFYRIFGRNESHKLKFESIDRFENEFERIDSSLLLKSPRTSHQNNVNCKILSTVKLFQKSLQDQEVPTGVCVSLHFKEGVILFTWGTPTPSNRSTVQLGIDFRHQHYFDFTADPNCRLKLLFLCTISITVFTFPFIFPCFVTLFVSFYVQAVCFVLRVEKNAIPVVFFLFKNSKSKKRVQTPYLAWKSKLVPKKVIISLHKFEM